MNLHVLSKVGFCFGVKRSIELSKQALTSNAKPLYLLGMLVHNDIVNQEFKRAGFFEINLDDLDLILKNTKVGTFISTAHGIKPEVKEKITKHGFKLIETTCPIVLRNNEKIKHFYDEGFEIIYVGKHEHSESNVIKEMVHIVENIEDINKLNINNKHIVIVNQTTMSDNDFNLLIPKILDKYPYALNNTEICPATLERQKELNDTLLKHHSKTDKWLIIGDSKSNNTKKLVEIVKTKTTNYNLVSSLSEVSIIDFRNVTDVYITSGTSTPDGLIHDITKYIEKENS